MSNKRGTIHDKLDGKINEDFYTKKYNEFNTEKIDLEKKMEQIALENKTVDYSDGIKLHRLASKAPNLITDDETDIESKRLALSELFSDFSLEGDKIRVKYTLGGEFLAQWMPKINSSFGPIKFGEDYEKTGILQPVSSSMLAYKDYFRTFKNVNIRGIKKLLLLFT